MEGTPTQQWNYWKFQEQIAVNNRRKIEDEIIKSINVAVPQSGTFTVDGLKITTKLDRKVDADKLQILADEAGLSDHLPSLFRWKPEINMRNWEATDKTITDKLLPAITTKPSRPSFKSIEEKEE